ncbi:hypothetical protein [Sorangium cellulosum]|uniref:hypothetical protein n=1 Tax=Sorangium cellulosum TaxID=56 RepID=UPI000317266B|nr:hypothetical protein [Sorangium cellulosum]
MAVHLVELGAAASELLERGLGATAWSTTERPRSKVDAGELGAVDVRVLKRVEPGRRSL